MSTEILRSALHYHNEGLCVIPVVYQSKNPALPEWEEYQTRRSTRDEITGWFGNGHQFNIGITHGEVSGNFVTIDVDHDQGIFNDMMVYFAPLFKGRIEQSGSGEGYHIPLRVTNLPDFGQDTKRERQRGNRTWKTAKGNVNIRARFCQTVVPPSLHPSGRRYHFIQKGNLVEAPDLDNLITWLDEMLPKKPVRVINCNKPLRPAEGNNLIEVVKAAWKDVITVFQEFEMVREITVEPLTGDFRLLGNGGLLVTEDRQKFYCFSDEVGGGLFEAWGYCRFGSAYDKRRHFRQVLLEMAHAAGIDTGQFYRTGDEQRLMITSGTNTQLWGKQYQGYWGRAR